MRSLVLAELHDIIGLLGHSEGSETCLLEEFAEVPIEIVEAIKREAREMHRLFDSGVISNEDCANVLTSIALIALVMGRRLEKLEVSLGSLQGKVEFATPADILG